MVLKENMTLKVMYKRQEQNSTSNVVTFENVTYVGFESGKFLQIVYGSIPFHYEAKIHCDDLVSFELVD